VTAEQERLTRQILASLLERGVVGAYYPADAAEPEDRLR
jgi:hypothetical protein